MLNSWCSIVLLSCVLRYIPESFRWYLSHDRSKDASEVIRNIAKFNRTSLADDEVRNMLHVERGHLTTGDKQKYTFIHLFKTRELTIITLLSALSWYLLLLLHIMNLQLFSRHYNVSVRILLVL